MRQTCFVACLLWCFMFPGRPAEDARRVLAIYDGQEEPKAQIELFPVQRYLAMPLNRLGFMMEVADAHRRPLPDASKYRAIVIWSQDPTLERADEFCSWLSAAIRGGTRVILIGGTGAEEFPSGDMVPETLRMQPERELGLEWQFQHEESFNPLQISRTVKRPEFFQFETRMPPSRVRYTPRVAPGMDVWVEHRRTDRESPAEAVIAVGPKGGWIRDAEDAVRVFTEPEYMAQWDLNPFAFLETSLGGKGMLRPDVTTAFGKRLAFAHIDGDGEVNMTQDFPGEPRFSARVAYDEIFSRYTFPISIGLVVARINPAALGKAEWIPFWKELMALPFVQSGCHGNAHPLIWDEGKVSLSWPGYTYSDRVETVDAVEYLNKNILPPDKPVTVYQWTGNCLPTEGALRLVREGGMLNINGGNARYDAKNPTVTRIPGIFRQQGSEWQVYAPGSNEFFYTDGWHENFGGFSAVIETFERSANPRLLPVNIYYHFYLCERQAGLRSLQKIYDWAAGQELCWLETSEYVRAALGFAQTRTGRDGENAWWVEHYADCRTMRLDGESRNVDLPLSENVLGFTHFGGSLYVTLDAADRAKIVLTEAAPSRLCLRESTSFLRKAALTASGGWEAEARLYGGKNEIQLQGAQAGGVYQIRIGETALTLTADAQGRLAIPLPGGVGGWVEVRVGN